MAIRSPRLILAVAAILTVAAAVFGIPVANHLSAGGFQDPGSESARAARLLSDKFKQSEQQMLITITDPSGASGDSARTAGTAIVDRLAASPNVLNVTSPWTSPPAAAAELLSKDGRTGLIVATMAGGENKAQVYAAELAAPVVGDRDGLTIRAGGTAMIYKQINDQTKSDLLLMEMIAVPLSFLVLVWVFGGLVAAALPMMVGVMSILGTMSVLRLITGFTEVSIFALNIATALGLALAVDYTLLIVSRYRDELAGGADRETALVNTMCTAGRTVLFSAVTVALSMAVMVVFPMNFLRSFAYAGVATVTFASLAAIVITPAAIMLLGDRLDSLDVRRLVRRVLGRPEPPVQPWHEKFWYRLTKFVMRRAVPIGLAVVALLVFLGAPFLGVRPGFPDDRVLPKSASAHQVGDLLRTGFGSDADNTVSVLIPDSTALESAQLSRYAADLSRVSDVVSVSAPAGTFVNGRLTGPPVAPTAVIDGSALLTVGSSSELFSKSSDAQLERMHAVAPPGGRSVEFGGLAQTNRDSVDAIMSRLPIALGLIAVIMLVLLFLLTGSVVMPVKALILNMLSLSATFGAMVWIFQEGHFGALGTTPTGTLVANMPVLMFCIAFGLSMDYEVFLVSRIREFWLDSAQTSDDNDESVALGLATTGRVITAAALIMAISFAALIAAQVSVMRLFGLGLTLAVVVDATLVRLVLVPAFMHVMGKYNWWAPAPLRAFHRKFGITESGGTRHTG